MRVLVAGQQITPEKPFNIENQYKGELDESLRKLEKTFKDFEKKHNLILKYNGEGCEEELGCIIMMDTVNLTSS
jgi:hypothetical protein